MSEDVIEGGSHDDISRFILPKMSLSYDVYHTEVISESHRNCFGNRTSEPGDRSLMIASHPAGLTPRRLSISMLSWDMVRAWIFPGQPIIYSCCFFYHLPFLILSKYHRLDESRTEIFHQLTCFGHSRLLMMSARVVAGTSGLVALACPIAIIATQ